MPVCEARTGLRTETSTRQSPTKLAALKLTQAGSEQQAASDAVDKVIRTVFSTQSAHSGVSKQASVQRDTQCELKVTAIRASLYKLVLE
jgi:hypothetical protein